MTKKVRTYSDEFKAEAVKKIADNNECFKSHSQATWHSNANVIELAEQSQSRQAYWHRTI